MNAYLNAVFYISEVVRVRQFDHFQFVLLLHVFHPFISLSLGIYHEWPAIGTGSYQSIVH